ncbi:hypothetical protein [Mycobacterium sp. 3519A]|uniref:hypothetical protein n=1 Tax=Mycobacterium sp. 3519A TaxID=2057184 RepID=UPI000C7AD65E|nr:hypothetical protein [Mycobacterium sp. 3519A]
MVWTAANSGFGIGSDATAAANIDAGAVVGVGVGVNSGALCAPPIAAANAPPVTQAAVTSVCVPGRPRSIVFLCFAAIEAPYIGE